MTAHTWERDGYVISTDAERLDVDAIHAFLRQAYWSPNVPRDVVERSIDNSLNFGLYDRDGAQVGFARMVTDRAAFGYLADVYVLEPHRRHGLGKWLVETVLAHPDLQGLRRIVLGTADAHSLYERYGFKPADASRIMTLDQSAEKLYD
jgi:N-acetylglutamate synthase-like GNAT family acetyltransferase